MRLIISNTGTATYKIRFSMFIVEVRFVLKIEDN